VEEPKVGCLLLNGMDGVCEGGECHICDWAPEPRECNAGELCCARMSIGGEPLPPLVGECVDGKCKYP
jgi:hypothetical protein